jgi:tetratricopeptide (TPR) repeat protein
MVPLHKHWLLALSAGLFSTVFALGIVQSWRQQGTIPDLDPDRLVEARALLLRGETARAIDQLAMYADIEPRRPDSWLRLGQALASVGESTRAIEALERSVQQLPAPVEAHQRLAVLYYEAGQLERARAHAQIVLRVHAPLPAAVLQGLALPSPPASPPP